MQGDFFVLVTHDITDNGYYLELFHYDSETPEDKYELFHTKDNVSFNIQDGEHRQFVSIFVEVSAYYSDLKLI